MPAALAERVVLLTGASSGIGAATARRLAAAGASLVLTGRREEPLQKLAADLDPSGWRVLAQAGDITAEADRGWWVARTLDRFGRLDALVNNAGYGQRGPLEAIPPEAVSRNFATNVFGTLALTQAALPALRASGGRIVMVGSVAGRIARPFSSVYDSTKHALEALTTGLRHELRPSGVAVVMIRPGFIDTGFVAAADAVSGTAWSHPPEPYAAAVTRARDRQDRHHRFAAPPDAVARVIERALASRRPRSAYAAPRHAHFLLAAHRLLPEPLWDAVVRRSVT